MKIKITEAGWAGFTGHFGMIEFADGVSVDDVSRADANYLAALVAIESVEDGKNPSPSQALLDARVTPAPVEQVATNKADEVPEPPKVWTAEELAAIADKKGLKGIREIAEPMGLKDNSIVDLIAKIVAKQAAAS